MHRGGEGEWSMKKKRAIGFNPIHEVCLRPQRMRNDPPVPTEFISRSNYWSLPARPIASTPRVNFTVLTNCKLQNVSPLFPSGWSGAGVAGMLPKPFQKRLHQRYIYKYGVINARTNLRILLRDVHPIPWWKVSLSWISCSLYCTVYNYLYTAAY